MKAYGCLPAGWAAAACALVKGESKRFIVDAAKSVTISILVEQRCIIKYYIGVTTALESHDVGFEMFFEPASDTDTDTARHPGQKRSLCQKERVNFPQWPEGLGGSALVPGPGKIGLVFDNGFSWITPKMISFKTTVQSTIL
jgi:hypothetical protein